MTTQTTQPIALSALDADALRSAADELDAVWRADEARGLRDGLGGAEYARLSYAPRLHAMADKIDADSQPPAARILRAAAAELDALWEQDRVGLRYSGGRWAPGFESLTLAPRLAAMADFLSMSCRAAA